MDARVLVIVIVMAIITPAASAQTAGASRAKDWEYSLAPSFFATGLQGDIGVDDIAADVDAGFNDIDDMLDFGAVLGFEARRRRWGVLGEVIYLNLSPSARLREPPGTEIAVGVEETIVSAALLRNIVDNPKARLDLLAGVRYFSADAEFKPRSGSPRLTGSDEWIDPVVGTKGRIGIDEKWFVAFHLDAGGFGAGSDLSWHGFAGAGYRFEWGDVVLGYRHLDVDYQGDDFAYDAYTGGVTLGAVLTF